MEKGVLDFVQKISKTKIKTFWLIDNPRYWDFNPFSCFERFYWLGERDKRQCNVAKEHAVNSAIVNAEVDILGSLESLKVIDFTKFYCDENVCNPIFSDAPIMRDGNHLTRMATIMLKDRLASYLTESN